MKIPGSKSVLQRLLLAMAYERSDMQFENYNPCSDVVELEQALKTFGYEISGSGEQRSFHFVWAAHKKSSHSYSFQYNATGFRLWLSFLAAQAGLASRIWVSDILLQRGYAPLTQALQAMGAKITLNGNLLEIQGAKLKGGRHHLAGDISSQYASSLILASPAMEQDLILELSPFQVSQSYIYLTIQIMEHLGSQTKIEGNSLIIRSTNVKTPSHYVVDSDISTVAYYAILAVLRGELVQIPIHRTMNLEQPDIRIYDFLRQMGVGVRRSQNYVKILPAQLRGTVLDLRDNPDMMPLLSILGLFCKDTLTLQNIGRLRHKESDRILGITKAFDLIGADYSFDGDSLMIEPYTNQVPELELDSQNDHRLVMAFTLLRSRFPGIRINDITPLKKSFPFDYAELCSLSVNDS